ncbi:universal stress protein [Natronosporangium hydrolyticum]|uniref:Universal stress protein n=1 Tax=Natronosporangium hydrolyticum TaxID=2811111 RepID=A0A895YQW4_9ACTN|nr:universal stress protein [Natronosporangium hydrolyticum]QSB16510.1 universal stress protein [Natronosporangium hydrolyticum]
MATVEELPIVVGVDGSEPSRAACRWAATEARLRGHPLELVYGYIGPALAVPLMAPPYDWLPPAMQEEAEELVAQAVAQVREQEPTVQVTGRAVAGAPNQLLVDLSAEAYQVVVGHRGHGGFRSLLLGSVASTVAAHAHAPVVVVRPGVDHAQLRDAPVVVGVDGSATAQAALSFAFEEAELRSVPVHAVHVYQVPLMPSRADEVDPARVERAERQRLRQWVQPIRDKYPHVTVEEKLLTGQPSERLVDAAERAGLLVIGSRGRGGFKGMLLGSVSQQVIRHAEGPVAVVR